jgi:S-adenosylmethionine hydrolase
MNNFLWRLLTLFLFSIAGNKNLFSQHKNIVFQTDFGLKDGAVAAMKGVAITTDSSLRLFDLTHEIPAYNIWEAAYRLEQTIPYWPAGTVFVSVVDPGVGTNRQSVVLKTKSGHFIVTPDNGTLTLVAETQGIESIRRIDETINRRKGSENSYTFHGRDVYAYTAARLASGLIRFEEVGPALPSAVVKIPYQKAVIENEIIKGSIPVLDIQYGNIWTNIPATMLKQMEINSGDELQVSIYEDSTLKYQGLLKLVATFGDVPDGKPLAYFNSLMNLSFAINIGNFSETHRISSGNKWKVAIKLSAIK